MYRCVLERWSAEKKDVEFWSATNKWLDGRSAVTPSIKHVLGKDDSLKISSFGLKIMEANICHIYFP